MPARPLSDATLQLIHALRDSLEAALAHHPIGVELEERSMFGCYCFFVDGKLCMGVKNDELLVRLPPPRHSELLETEGLRELSPGGGMQGYFWISPDAYARRADWQQWVNDALAYNPQAKATPKKARKPQRAVSDTATTAAKTIEAGPSNRHSAAKGTAAVRRSSPSGSQQRTSASKKPASPTPAAKPAPARPHSVFDDDDL